MPFAKSLGDLNERTRVASVDGGGSFKSNCSPMDALKDFSKTPAGRFLTRYVIILIVSFVLLALKPVNDRVVNPYTTFVAHEAKIMLNLFGEQATVVGQALKSPRYSVLIYNGCNGLEAILIFVSGVLAFPAAWRAKTLGVLLGFVAIQLFNIVRVVALFYTGIYWPKMFSVSHIFVWQSLVILFGVVLWLIWVLKYAAKTREA